MDGQSRQSEDQLDQRWPRYEAAATGFRHYWYPVLEARKLRKRESQRKAAEEQSATKFLRHAQYIPPCLLYFERVHFRPG